MPSSEITRRASYGSMSPVVGERGARTRQSIIDAALELFESQGFHATAVDDIAGAVGVSRATLYQYFESKEQLFVELLHESGAAMLRVVRRLGPLGPTETGYDNLHWWLGEWAWVYDRYSTMYVQWANVETPEAPLRPLILQFMDGYTSRMSERLVASKVKGLPPESAALTMLAVVNRTNYYRHTTAVRGLSDNEVLDTLATVTQLALFPDTPADAFATVKASAPRSARPSDSRQADPDVEAHRPADDRFAGASDKVRSTVRQLLDAGGRVFGARGFNVASVDDIVTDAGLGRGTFYKYFGDKLDLLSALAEECADQLNPMMSAFSDIPTGKRGAAARRAWLGEFVRFHRRYAGVFRVLQQQAPIDPALEAMRASVAQTVLVALDAMLGQVDRRYPFSIPAASLILWALLERLPDQVLGSRYDMEPEALADLMGTVIERGFLNGTSREAGSARSRR
jgi:AcrR family transcriptional regulator